MIFRSVDASELDRLRPLLVVDPASPLTAEQFQLRIGTGEYRPEWTWIAEEAPGAAPAAAAIWWGSPSEDLPAALDGLFAAEPGKASVPAPSAQASNDTNSPAGLAPGLLAAGHRAFAAAGLPRPPDFHILLPPDWRDRADVSAALAWRLRAAKRAGLTSQLERLSYQWTPETAAPHASPARDAAAARLRFRPEGDDEVFVDVFRRALEGTLDATSRMEAEASGPESQARQDIKVYRDRMRGERSWWRIAETPAGEIAGFGIPSRNDQYPVVGYLGVLPQHRGRNYVDEILAEVTKILVTEASATRIHADTDLDNRPMVAAFERAGYQNVGRRLVLSAPRARAPDQPAQCPTWG